MPFICWTLQHSTAQGRIQVRADSHKKQKKALTNRVTISVRVPYHTILHHIGSSSSYTIVLHQSDAFDLLHSTRHHNTGKNTSES
eukprot:14747978-Ditylum_brightwellii.AAC.1